MPRRLICACAVACLLLVVFAASVRYGRGDTGAHDVTPASHDGQHGQAVPASPEATARSPYADELDPNAAIRSLTSDEVAQIERGEGAGFALPAELNGVPGPRHVLDLAVDLGLSDQQVKAVHAIFEEMQAVVVPAGRRYLDAVRALEEEFRAGSLTEAELPDLIVEIQHLEGELAAAHLLAHLQTARVLTAEQIDTYRQLRGYKEGHGGDDGA